MKLFFVIIVMIASLTLCQAQFPQNKNPVNKYHNKIDDIENSGDIDKILENSIDKKKFEVFIIRNELKFDDQGCAEFAKTIGIKPWIKADFDNNGYTDILVNGDNYGTASVVIMDEGKNNFVVKDFIGMMSKCSFLSVKDSASEPIIVYHEFKISQPIEKELIYKYGDFIEKNDKPQQYKIEKIEYKTTGCYGKCPMFELNIDADHQALFKPFAYNKKKKGTYKGKINEGQYQELIGLLNYIDFPNLDNEYLSGGTDQQNSFLTITYDNGKIKKIMDYSLRGTFGLRRLHKIMLDLRENHNWK